MWNKKSIAYYITLLAGFMCFYFICLCSPSSICFAAPSLQNSFIMPSSLVSIGDEAFTDTDVKTIVFGEKLKRIGERSFADLSELERVFISPSVEKIAEGAFDGSHSFTVFGVKNSYAEDWARQHGFPFVHFDVWFSFSSEEWEKLRCTASLSYIKEEAVFVKSISMNGRHIDEGRSMRPQERPELHVIDERFP